MKITLALLCSPLLAVMLAVPALADSTCTMTALRDTAAVDNPRSIMSKGHVENAVSQFRVDNRTGDTSLCSHGGYCYPTHVMVNGKTVEAIRMTNCRPNMSSGIKDANETVYDVEIIRSQVPAPMLRRADVERKFSEMGLCSACSDNVTQYYVNQPKSQCAMLAKRALEGDPDATKQLQDNPPYCVWHYR